jgi:exonuclease III
MLMRIASFNANGLVGKAEAILDCILHMHVNMFIILETHLHDGSSIFRDTVVDLRKPKTFDHLGRARRQQGGILVYASEDTKPEVNVLYEDPDANFVVLEAHNTVIAAAYLAPSLNNSCIAEFIEKATEIAAREGAETQPLDNRL